MNQKERKQAGLPYRVCDAGLMDEQAENKKRVFEFNNCPPWEQEKMADLIRRIFGKTGNDPWVISPFHCDYGYNIEVGDNFICNYNCVMLDVNKITIGDNVKIGPNVTITTAGHPVHPVTRNSGYEYGIPITVGDNVWIGCNVVINPGVNIGRNTVIGSGSVVTRDLPADVIAVGNPCRVMRKITDDDRDFYFKKLKFDVSDY